MPLRYLWETLRGFTFRQTPARLRMLEFEFRYGVRLPADMSAYYSTSNGMFDEKSYVRISQLEDVRPLSVEDPGSARYFDTPELMFVFADYLLWSWAYAISLSPNSNYGCVFMVDYFADQPVADSFGSFLSLIAENSPRLYGG